MPRGFIELYADLSILKLFSDVENLLNLNKFHIEHPDTCAVQVWNKEGDMIEANKDKVYLYIEAGMLITYWNTEYNSISITFDKNTNNLNNCILFIDGFNAKETKGIFNSILSFMFLQKNGKFKGFIFDRREITESVDLSGIFTNDVDTNSFIRQNEFEIVSKISITAINRHCIDNFQENNAYVVHKKATVLMFLS